MGGSVGRPLSAPEATWLCGLSWWAGGAEAPPVLLCSRSGSGSGVDVGCVVVCGCYVGGADHRCECPAGRLGAGAAVVAVAEHVERDEPASVGGQSFVVAEEVAGLRVGGREPVELG